MKSNVVVAVLATVVAGCSNVGLVGGGEKGTGLSGPLSGSSHGSSEVRGSVQYDSLAIGSQVFQPAGGATAVGVSLTQTPAGDVTAIFSSPAGVVDAAGALRVTPVILVDGHDVSAAVRVSSTSLSPDHTQVAAVLSASILVPGSYHFQATVSDASSGNAAGTVDVNVGANTPDGSADVDVNANDGTATGNGGSAGGNDGGPVGPPDHCDPSTANACCNNTTGTPCCNSTTPTNDCGGGGGGGGGGCDPSTTQNCCNSTGTPNNCCDAAGTTQCCNSTTGVCCNDTTDPTCTGNGGGGGDGTPSCDGVPQDNTTAGSNDCTVNTQQSFDVNVGLADSNGLFDVSGQARVSFFVTVNGEDVLDDIVALDSISPSVVQVDRSSRRLNIHVHNVRGGAGHYVIRAGYTDGARVVANEIAVDLH